MRWETPNFLQRGRGEWKIYCSEGLEAVPARPFGKGKLEAMKSVGSVSKVMASGISEYDGHEYWIYWILGMGRISSTQLNMEFVYQIRNFFEMTLGLRVTFIQLTGRSKCKIV